MTSVAARAKRRYRAADEDVEMFGSALDPKVVRRMAPYILPQKNDAATISSATMLATKFFCPKILLRGKYPL